MTDPRDRDTYAAALLVAAAKVPDRRALPPGVEPLLRVAELDDTAGSQGFGEYLEVYGAEALEEAGRALEALGRDDAVGVVSQVARSRSWMTRWLRPDELEARWVDWLELEPPVRRTLVEAAERLRADPAVEALAKRASNARPPEERVAIVQLVAGGASVAAVMRVLDRGADPNARDSLGRPVLVEAAARADGAPILEALIRAGAELTPRSRRPHASPLDTAAGRDHARNVATLLAAGAVPTAETALAAGAASIAMIVEAGAPIEARDAHGQTPLLRSARRPDLARRLLALGADPTVADTAGRTVLHEATDPALLETFLAAGADPEARNAKGDTPLEHHRKQWQKRCVEVLERGRR